MQNLKPNTLAEQAGSPNSFTNLPPTIITSHPTTFFLFFTILDEVSKAGETKQNQTLRYQSILNLLQTLNTNMSALNAVYLSSCSSLITCITISIKIPFLPLSAQLSIKSQLIFAITNLFS